MEFVLILIKVVVVVVLHGVLHFLPFTFLIFFTSGVESVRSPCVL